MFWPLAQGLSSWVLESLALGLTSWVFEVEERRQADNKLKDARPKTQRPKTIFYSKDIRKADDVAHGAKTNAIANSAPLK